MKKIFSFLFAVLFVFQSFGTALAIPITPLSDIAGHKYQTAIEYLFSKKIVKGYDDGTFKPDSQINRAELLKILVGGAGYTDPDATKYKNCFPDVHEEWYAKYVCFAKEKGWVQGFSDGLFKPEQPAAKVEAIKMLLNSEGVPITTQPVGKSIYSDVDFAQWYGPYMYVAEAMDIVDIVGGKYGPQALITRGETSNNIYRTMLVLEQKVGSFDQVVLGQTNTVNPQQFDAPVLTVTSTDPVKVLLNWTTPANSGDSALKMYTLDYKLANDLDYKSVEYSVEYYNAKLKSDGGIVLTAAPNTMYHFRVKAVNINGHVSDYSNVFTITTAQPLEPDAPVVEKVDQTFSTISLKVTLPKYTGDSALDSIFSDFTDPNDGSTQSGSVGIEANKIVDSWTVKYTLNAKAGNAVQPDYSFTFWVNNKNGKVSQKTTVKFAGLSANPDATAVTVSSLTKDGVSFTVDKPVYAGSTPIAEYGYSIDSSSDPQANLQAGTYSKDFFEKNLNGVLSLGALSANTSYTVSFWVVNMSGNKSNKVSKIVTTPVN